MKADDAKRLKELERENGGHKRIVTDRVLDIERGLRAARPPSQLEALGLDIVVKLYRRVRVRVAL
jgi:hypothetical protein